MPWVAAVGSIVGGYMSSSAAQDAASTQSQAAGAAANLQAQTTREQLKQQQAMYDANVARQQPWATSGQNANTSLQSFMGLGDNTGQAGFGQGLHQFGAEDLNTNLAPGYQFALQQGNQALSHAGAASGMAGSGQQMADISKYNVGQAQQGYQQAYENYQTNQNNLYNRLSGISTTGQNAAAGVGAQGTQVSSNMANTAMAGTAASNNYLTSAAAASAAGQIGAANAWGNALNTSANAYMTNQWMNRAYPK
jgi:hypothetical protein